MHRHSLEVLGLYFAGVVEAYVWNVRAENHVAEFVGDDDSFGPAEVDQMAGEIDARADSHGLSVGTVDEYRFASIGRDAERLEGAHGPFAKRNNEVDGGLCGIRAGKDHVAPVTATGPIGG